MRDQWAIFAMVTLFKPAAFPTNVVIVRGTKRSEGNDQLHVQARKEMSQAHELCMCFNDNLTL